MDRPGERHIQQTYLEGHPQYQPASRVAVRNVIHNGNDFSEAYLKIHQIIGDPRFEQDLRPKSPMIQRWNQEVQMQLDENRHNLGSKIANIRTVLAGDPKLTPLTQRVENIMGDFNRNPYRDLPNDQFIDHNKKRNQDLIVVADQTFTKDNRNPVLSANPEISRTSTIKIYQNENNTMTRFEVDKEFPGDKVNVVQVKQMDQQPSSSGTRRPMRTPAKQQVNIGQNTLVTNPDYDPSNLVKSFIHHEEAKEASNKKFIFANDTDPVSATKKRQAPVERYVVVQQVESSKSTPMKPKEDPYVEKVVITSNEYRDPHRAAQYEPTQQRPQPFQQYIIHERMIIEPASGESKRETSIYYRVPAKSVVPANEKKKLEPASYEIEAKHEISSYYRVPVRTVLANEKRIVEPDSREIARYYEKSPYYTKPKPIHPAHDRIVQEPAEETREVYNYVKPRPKMLPRVSKFSESREISIQYPAQFFSQQQILREIPLETSSRILP